MRLHPPSYLLYIIVIVKLKNKVFSFITLIKKLKGKGKTTIKFKVNVFFLIYSVQNRASSRAVKVTRCMSELPTTSKSSRSRILVKREETSQKKS